MKESKPSEVIESFIKFLEDASRTHIMCETNVDTCGKKNIDYLHDMEFAKDKSARNKIATKIHNNQVERRNAKDKVLLFEKPAIFFQDKMNKSFIGQLKRLLKEQRDREAYLESQREYSRRAGEDNDNS